MSVRDETEPGRRPSDGFARRLKEIEITGSDHSDLDPAMLEVRFTTSLGGESSSTSVERIYWGDLLDLQRVVNEAVAQGPPAVTP